MSIVTRIDLPLAEFMAGVARRPTVEVMRHRRRNGWASWTLAEMEARSVLLASALPPARLVALSGDYAPPLSLVALAAARAGAGLVVLPPAVPRAALVAWLAEVRPDLAFVGQREQVGIWRAAVRQAGTGTTILADIHLPWGTPRHEGVLSLTELAGAPPQGRANAPDGVVWIEEGTEWAEGLCFILRTAARGELVLAFPETRAAAARDRSVAQPVGLVLSAAHHRQLQADLCARLPVGIGLTPRAIRGALEADRPGPLGRWLLRRLRQPLGLARLRAITVVGDRPAAGRDLFASLGIEAGHEAGGRVAPTDLAFA